MKISAIYLWYFTPLFLLIVSRVGNRLLQQGSLLGDLIIRYPYQWDYELMFAGFYLIWGIFLWKAAKDPAKNISFIKFTAYGFFANVATNLIVGLFRTEELVHLLTDSILWFMLACLMFRLNNKIYGNSKKIRS